jgi:hypothetical protein
MKKFKNVLILGAGFFFLSIMMPSLYSFAGATFFKYVDKNGTVHFTDRYESIPLEYREQIKTLREESPTPSPALPLEEKKKESEPAAGEPAVKAQELERKEAEKSEARKKEAKERKLKAAEAKEKQIAELQKQIEDKRKQQRSLRTNWMVQDRNIIIRLNREIADLEKRIKGIQEELAEGK